MGKRSSFVTDALGRYDTPASAAAPLLPHLVPGTRYWEPCAGALKLVEALAPVATCVAATDIEPRAEGVYRMPADQVTAADVRAMAIDAIITNPPWPKGGQRGDPTLSLLRCWVALAPTWALLPADFQHNRYFAEVGPWCAKIVSVGRVSWAGNGVGGKDNAAWFFFTPYNTARPRFYWRDAA